jgi:uncharacterized protein with PIN domain
MKMQAMTQELRAALIHGEGYGFPSVADAPERFQNRIAAIRHALVENRTVPTREYSNGHSSVVAASTDADLRLRLKLQGDEIRKQAAEQKKAEQKKVEDRELCPTCGKPIEDADENDDNADETN